MSSSMIASAAKPAQGSPRWFAYDSQTSGKPEVYVQTMPGVEPSGRWQVSAEGGIYPRWRRDGRELYYAAPDRTMMAVDVETVPAFRLGTPHALFRAPPAPRGVTTPVIYDVQPDGGKFLFITPGAATNDDAPIQIIVNWQQLLKTK